MKIGKYNLKEIGDLDSVFTPDIAGNREWYEKSWAGFMGLFYVVGFGISILNLRMKDSFRFAICFFKDDKITWFWDARDLERARNKVIETYILSPKTVNSWLKLWKTDWQNFLKTAKALEKINLSALSDKKLSEWCRKITSAYVISNSLPYIVDSFLSTGEKDWLVETIKEDLGNKATTEVISKLTLTVSDSFSQKEHVSLLKIASLIVKNKKLKEVLVNKSPEDLMNDINNYPEIYKLLKKHANDYYWIENGYYHAPCLTEKYFLDKICKLPAGEISKMYKKEIKQSEENRRVKDRIIKKLKINNKLRKIIKLSEVFSQWQDTRKSAVFRANHFIFRILDELARRKNISNVEAYYLISSEVTEILSGGKVNVAKLKSRRENGCAVIFTKDGWMFTEDEDYKKIDKSIFFEKQKNVNELKGVSASPGKVKGVVRVIFKPTDFRKLKQGEILVTNNTTPDFVPIMKLAGAILTEQGGITSHAAVVSRELKIPCVIGIKSVTKIIKDGDIVEVDASIGIIKMVK